MEERRVDPMRDHIDDRKLAFATFLTQPRKSALELFAGEVCVDHDTISLFERRCILFVDDFAVQRNVTNDLQPITVRAKDPQVILEHPDVVQNKNDLRVDLFNQSFCLERREDIAALRIRGMNCQALVTYCFAGIPNSQIVNLVTIRESPHDAVHYSRQSCAVSVESDGDYF
jgi:hypothetical protein